MKRNKTRVGAREEGVCEGPVLDEGSRKALSRNIMESWAKG